MLTNCIPNALEKRVQVWKYAALASTLCRAAFVITLGVLVVGLLMAPRAVVGNCYIIYTDSAKVETQLELAKMEGNLGKMSVGTEGEKFEAKLSTRGLNEAMRQVRMRDESEVSSDNKEVLEYRTGACVNNNPKYFPDMIHRRQNGMLFFKEACWTGGECFAASRTFDGEECNCQSEHASASCQQKCFDECTVCNCQEAEDSDDGSGDCVRDMVLHQHFEWAATECESDCNGRENKDDASTECLLCRQKNYQFIDKCSMANPHVGGNKAQCEGEVPFDYQTFASHQYMHNCTNPEGCQVYNWPNDYSDWVENNYMPLEAWNDAAEQVWTEIDGRDSYPNVFAMKSVHNVYTDHTMLQAWEEHSFPQNRRLTQNPDTNEYTMEGCKWQYGAWEPLTTQSWSAGSRQFQKDLALGVEVVQSNKKSVPALDKCQTAGMQIGDSEEESMGLVNWDINEVLMAQSVLYLMIFAMKTFVLNKTRNALNKDLKELDNSQKESLSQEVKRVEKPGCCSRILGCFLCLENLCAKIQTPFFNMFMILMPAYVLAPLLQATCHAGFIIAPAGDIWIIRWVGWSLLGMIVWWFACQILSQWSQKCKVISQFCNIASTLPLACLGAAIVYYELLKLGKKGFGFEFALFFNQIFSFSFTIGMELSVDFLQLLFSFTIFVDTLAGFAGCFTKRGWEERFIWPYLVKNFKHVEPSQKQTETSV